MCEKLYTSSRPTQTSTYYSRRENVQMSSLPNNLPIETQHPTNLKQKITHQEPFTPSNPPRPENIIHGDLTQLGRHRRRRRLTQCDLIDCITMFQSEFEKSFISCSVLVKFTLSLHFFATWESLFWRFSVNLRDCGRVLVSDRFIQRIAWIMILSMNLW